MSLKVKLLIIPIIFLNLSCFANDSIRYKRNIFFFRLNDTYSELALNKKMKQSYGQNYFPFSLGYKFNINKNFGIKAVYSSNPRIIKEGGESRALDIGIDFQMKLFKNFYFLTGIEYNQYYGKKNAIASTNPIKRKVIGTFIGFNYFLGKRIIIGTELISMGVGRMTYTSKSTIISRKKEPYIARLLTLNLGYTF